eukprot:TRINITY_DN59625_c0_g1_i1.p1 TRINITY_DN59625_c0_g1~~TRINITY_DN59625_c0_g1_i1.p1  ORF type:complete len:128 (-),score=20.36 TRINITY_DN59625_c0_g1_i1:426-809(-)
MVPHPVFLASCQDIREYEAALSTCTHDEEARQVTINHCAAIRDKLQDYYLDRRFPGSREMPPSIKTMTCRQILNASLARLSNPGNGDVLTLAATADYVSWMMDELLQRNGYYDESDFDTCSSDDSEA